MHIARKVGGGSKQTRTETGKRRGQDLLSSACRLPRARDRARWWWKSWGGEGGKPRSIDLRVCVPKAFVSHARSSPHRVTHNVLFFFSIYIYVFTFMFTSICLVLFEIACFKCHPRMLSVTLLLFVVSSPSYMLGFTCVHIWEKQRIHAFIFISVIIIQVGKIPKQKKRKTKRNSLYTRLPFSGRHMCECAISIYRLSSRFCSSVSPVLLSFFPLSSCYYIYCLFAL